jgi:cobalt-precorrin-5B (C1)-methyltransferase
MELKELGKGYTTGTCAQAAAKASGLMLLTQRQIDFVEVDIPSGKTLTLEILDPKINTDRASCAIEKDSGDDPDATDGIKIRAEVRFSQEKGIIITGSEGVGMVTKPGLAVKVGEYAINPVPRKMIRREIEKLLADTQAISQGRGLEVIISVPRGREIARQTFNSRVGVVDGISILGTTGIVEPKSLEAYKASLALQLDVLKAAGYPRTVLVLGYVGEKFCKEVLGFKEDVIIKIGDHVGFMLDECAKKDIKDILLVGHIAKLAKVAAGQFNTHCQFGDARIKTLVVYAKLCGAEGEIIQKIAEQKTAEAAVDILREGGLGKVFDKLAQGVVKRISRNIDPSLRVTCGVLSLPGELLGSYPPLKPGICNRISAKCL